MSEISKGTEIFSKIKSGAIIFEDTNFPQKLEEIQTFYGNLNGASTPPTTKFYLSGERIGIATDRPQQTIGQKTFQHLTFKATERSSGGLFGWGAGKYTERDGGAWACLDDIVTDKKEAETLTYNRVNALQIAKDKKLNDILNPDGSKPNKDTLGNGTDKKTSNTPIFIGVSVFLGGGLLYWNSKRKKANRIAAQTAQQSQMPIYQNVKL
jgi:hypothetical protein